MAREIPVTNKTCCQSEFLCCSQV